MAPNQGDDSRQRKKLEKSVEVAATRAGNQLNTRDEKKKGKNESWGEDPG